MNANNQILLPVVILNAWTMVMWFWMYLTRIPAIFKARMRLDSNAPRGEQMNSLPAKVRWKADNYNHLMEQPTIFYAVVITIAVLGEGNGTNLFFAWAYVVLRIIHSLVQSLGNRITLRFFIFTLGSFALIGLVINALTYFIYF